MILHRILSVLLMIGAALALELLFGRRRSPRPRRSRWPANLGLGCLARLGTGNLILWVHAISAGWGYRVGRGFFDRLGWDLLVKYAAFLLVVDFAQYWGHRLQHSVPLLWRIHAIHHTDLEVDATTTARVHPLQALVNIATATVALMLGLGGIVLGFRTLKQAFSVASHTNVRVPALLDRVLRWFIVTPSYHLVHHSAIGTEMNSNYCSVFTFWDRLFGTYTELSRLPVGPGAFGLAERRDPMRLGFWRLMLLPFRPDFPSPDPAAAPAR
ncbi:MAG: sterol desaturase family protein [Elusimicrobia bacterium]|nr:sterol desaturase family protein [Elusimicrobiota bacterium]